MLRKLGYILTSAILLAGSAATIGNAIKMMDTDVSYGDSKALYFKISEKNTTHKGVRVENYIQQKDGYGAVNSVASEIEKRLQNWDISAEVDKEGYDTVKVTVRTAKNDATEYRYLQDYLSFSGQDITIGVGAPTKEIQKEAPSHESYRNNNMFNGKKAAIEYINNVPVVTIEVNEGGENGQLNELIKYAKENTTEANQESSIEAKTTYIVLWNHFQEGDNYLDATSTKEEGYDPNMSKRLVFGESASNAWFVDSNNENNNFKKFQIIPNSEAIANGNFDSSKANAAYKAALYYSSILNASSYDYDVTFDYQISVPATIDPMLSASDWHLGLNFGPTMIAILVSAVVAAAVLVLFYRLGALSIISNTLLSVELAILLFAYFGAQYGIGALVGFALGALVTVFGGAYYYSKLKEELYKGRSLKKADAEAARKALWPTVDAGIVSIIVGLCVYGFIPGPVGKMGLSLILTAAFGMVLNIVLQRLEGWMLANDHATEKTMAKTYFVDEKKFPNLVKEEKQTYFGPYADKDFSKSKKPVSLVAGGLLLASAIVLTIFASLNGGNAFNYAGAYENTTTVAMEYRVASDSQATRTMATKTQAKELLSLISYQSKTLDKLIVDDVNLEKTVSFVSDDTEVLSLDVYHFDIPLSVYFKAESTYDFTIGGSTKNDYLTTILKEAAESNPDSRNITIISNTVVYQAGSPTLATIYLGVGIASVALLIYYFLRFKLSRAVPAIVFSFGGTIIVAGLIATSRLSVTPIVSLALVGSLLLGSLLSLFILNKEKEAIKDSREKEKDLVSFRNECLHLSASQSAGDAVIFVLTSLGLLLPFIAIAPESNKVIFLGLAISSLIDIALCLFLFDPFGKALANGLNSLKLSVKKSWDNRPRLDSGANMKKRSSEPEEATFIGIND